MFGNGATTFIKWITISKALKKIPEALTMEKQKSYVAAHGNSAPIAAAPVTVIMKIPAIPMSVLDMIYTAFDV